MADETIETIKIAAEEQGQRLDRVLTARIPALSRSRLKALILDGRVTIAARTIRDPASHVKSGDTVTVTLPAPEQRPAYDRYVVPAPGRIYFQAALGIGNAVDFSKRPLIVDPVYGSPIVTQLINKILLDGKKTVAESIVYGALEGVREKTQQDPVVVLKRALDNVRPSLEVRSRRVGGATYQVPVEVRPVRATTLALRWLTDYSRARREKTMTERLMNEILDASNGLGAAVKRREDMHKMAESNRAFAHYRW